MQTHNVLKCDTMQPGTLSTKKSRILMSEIGCDAIVQLVSQFHSFIICLCLSVCGICAVSINYIYI
jgi:hypothetical protein